MQKNRLTLVATTILAAGTFAFLGNNSFAQDEPADKPGASATDKPSASATGGASLPAGVTKSTSTDEAGIRQALAKTVETVLKEGQINQLSQCVASNDRTRLMRLNADQLNQKVSQLRTEFKNKYQQEFDIKEEVVFGEQAKGIEIVQGEISNPALLSNWPVTSGKSSGASGSGATGTGSGSTTGDKTAPPDSTDSNRIKEPGRPGDPGNLTDRTSGAGASGTASGAGASGTAGLGAGAGAGASGAASLNRGMNVAIVILPANEQTKAPEVTVSLVRESGAGARGGAGAGAGAGGIGASGNIGASGAGASGGAAAGDAGASGGAAAGAGARPGAGADAQASGDWKIDIPNSVTADQLTQNLSKHIDEVMGMKEQWPADANEAYRAISQHVLMAFYDQGGAGGAARPGAGAGGASGTGSGTSSPRPDLTR